MARQGGSPGTAVLSRAGLSRACFLLFASWGFALMGDWAHLRVRARVLQRRLLVRAVLRVNPCPPAALQDSELTTTQRMAGEMVQRMFASPAWAASPRQNEIYDVMRALEGQAAEVGHGLRSMGMGGNAEGGTAGWAHACRQATAVGTLGCCKSIRRPPEDGRSAVLCTVSAG